MGSTWSLLLLLILLAQFPIRFTIVHHHIGTVLRFLAGQPAQHQPVESSGVQSSHLGIEVQQVGLALPVETLGGRAAHVDVGLDDLGHSLNANDRVSSIS